MKKLLVILLLLAASVCAGAQSRVYLGGHIGLTPGRDGYGLGVNLAPEIGYHVNPYLSVGGMLSYQSRYSAFGLTPYVRWTALDVMDRFMVFIEAETPIRFYDGSSSFGAYLRPGLFLRLADSLGLVAHLGYFGYSAVRSGSTRSSGWLARLDSDSISIGFCVYL